MSSGSQAALSQAIHRQSLAIRRQVLSGAGPNNNLLIVCTLCMLGQCNSGLCMAEFLFWNFFNFEIWILYWLKTRFQLASSKQFSKLNSLSWFYLKRFHFLVLTFFLPKLIILPVSLLGCCFNLPLDWSSRLLVWKRLLYSKGFGLFSNFQRSTNNIHSISGGAVYAIGFRGFPIL